MPTAPTTVQDAVLGEVTVQPDQPQMQDFIIIKGERAGGGASGGPTYHFAVVVDDAAMGVTHVIRGQEHLNNTIKHVALQDALGLPRPTYAHIPLIFNPDGSKMSKRDKAKAARAAAKLADETTIRQIAEHTADEYLQKTPWVPPGEVQEMFARRYPADVLLPNETSLRTRFQLKGDPTPDQRPGLVEALLKTLLEFIEGKNDHLIITALLAEKLNVSLPEIDVDDFRRTGYLPEVMNNYLALLGWNPGGNVEQFGERPLDFIAEHFSLDRVQKGSAKFDRDKLHHFNHEYITALPLDEFKERLRTHFNNYHPEFAAIVNDEAKFAKFAETYQPRCHVLSEPAELGRFFVEPPARMTRRR